MILIDEVFISDEIFTTNFRCNLDVCNGDCCRIGDMGAPLTYDEAEQLESLKFDSLKELNITAHAIQLFKKGNSGVEWYRGKPYTSMMMAELQGFCIYSKLENKMIKCALEESKLLPFLKPISCHLFPIRVKTFLGREWLTLERREVECAHAFESDVPLIYSLKRAIIRGYGEKFYEKLKKKMKLLRSNKKN